MKLARREQLWMKLGAARQQAPAAWRLGGSQGRPERHAVHLRIAESQTAGGAATGGALSVAGASVRPGAPEPLWEFYIQLTHVEEAFKNLKGDLALRPIFHQRQSRIEAHIFVAFLAYCLHVTLQRRLRDLAPGLTPRSVLEKFSAMQMIDVHLPTTDGREVILTRYTQPESDQELLLRQLKLQLPEQPPPKIRTLKSAPV